VAHAVQEIEIRRITIGGQPVQKVSTISKNKSDVVVLSVILATGEPEVGGWQLKVDSRQKTQHPI
jgi:hypothetical protein